MTFLTPPKFKCIFSALCVVVLALLCVSEGRALVPPQLVAQRTGSSAVSVTVHTATKKKTHSLIEIARSFNQHNYHVLRLLKISSHGMAKLVDHVKSDTTFVYYRSRVVGASKSGWGEAVRVEIVTPTPVPEPRDDPPDTDPTPAPKGTPVPDWSNRCPESDINFVYNAVNLARLGAGVPALNRQPQLANSSQAFSKKMATTKAFAHDGWYDNILSFGYSGSAAGQNIAFGYDAAGVMNAWMNSEGHRRNILAGAFSDTGVGCALDEKGVRWWTQDFGG